MQDCRLIIETETDAGWQARSVALAAYVRENAAEAAEDDAIAWIKALRHARVNGLPLREALTCRGDSLWWFVELHFHKRRVVRDALLTALALEALVERERPRAITLRRGGHVPRCVGPQVAARHGIRWRDRSGRRLGALLHRVGIAVRSTFCAISAIVARVGRRPHRAGCNAAGDVAVAVFVHSAFCPSGGSSDFYLGPTIEALERRLGARGLALVGIGSRRRGCWGWRQRASRSSSATTANRCGPISVKSYASARDMKASLTLWWRRGSICRALTSSPDVRRLATLRGCDLWPVLRDEWMELSYLHLPWAARAMDQAAAALDALQPDSVVTYAEAGGWGRAIVLEARRRGMRTVGFQHGFIFRHWLNYRHEDDEMRPSRVNPEDRGFPRPDVTVLHDHLAAAQLTRAGRFPPSSLAIAGSPRLEALCRRAWLLTDAELLRLRSGLGAAPGDHLVLLAAKYTEVAGVIGSLLKAIAETPGVRLLVKCHPAERREPYARIMAGARNVTILSPDADLAVLIHAARLLVTVNSTAAIEAAFLGVPALVLALPSNLSPIVEAGAAAGLAAGVSLRQELSSLVYDEQRRTHLVSTAREFWTRHGPIVDGRAAERGADMVIATVPSVPASLIRPSEAHEVTRCSVATPTS